MHTGLNTEACKFKTEKLSVFLTASLLTSSGHIQRETSKLNKSVPLLVCSAIVKFSLLRQHRGFVSSSQFMPLFLPEMPS